MEQLDFSWSMVVTPILALSVILAEYLHARKRPDKWLLSVPTLLAMAHTIVFYIVVNLVRYSVIQYPLSDLFAWSSIIRLHNIFTFFMLALYRYVSVINLEKNRQGLYYGNERTD